ncbi:MAG: hypothetical protein HQP61_10815 [Peptococcaceae bacterium]|nr:hypothetical protein [Candidatus Syntrophopropionicum ammoniitolerans]
MAGYIFNLNSVRSLEQYIENGIYATKLSSPKNGRWLVHHEGTFADYATMKPGDNIYFFIQRNIYGIGHLVEVAGDCKFLNFPRASQPAVFDYEDIQPHLLWDEGQESVNQRWLCLFQPSPYFFKNGIDMDDVLASNPGSFRMLRAFWKLSFIKIDDDENQALIDAIVRRNQHLLDHPGDEVYQSNYQAVHNNLTARLAPQYRLHSRDILTGCARDTYIAHEMAIEAGLLEQLAAGERETVQLLGEWDYLSHQVVASPFKPIDYMDKMDVFGYSYVQGFNRTKSKYLVAELKKDGANVDDVHQLMKYVDWVKDEYSFGDYSMIEAFLLAYDFPAGVVDCARQVGERKYIIGRRPARSATWSNLRLVRYAFNPAVGRLEFREV